MVFDDLVTVCPYCYSADVRSSNYTGMAAGKDRNKLCGFCNSTFAASEFLLLDREAVLRRRERWERENRGFVRMKRSMRLLR